MPSQINISLTLREAEAMLGAASILTATPISKAAFTRAWKKLELATTRYKFVGEIWGEVNSDTVLRPLILGGLTESGKHI